MNGEADGESALQPSSLFCHTHSLAYAVVARQRQLAPSTTSSIRHRRSGIVDFGIVDFGIDRLEGAAPTKQERARRGCARVQAASVSWVCAGLRC